MKDEDLQVGSMVRFRHGTTAHMKNYTGGVLSIDPGKIVIYAFDEEGRTSTITLPNAESLTLLDE